MQIISKNGRVYCKTKVHYPEEIIRSMKKAGYRVKEVQEDVLPSENRGKRN